MPKFNVEIIELDEIKIYGFSKRSNDKALPKDIKELSSKYHNIIDKKPKIPFFVLSRDYDIKTKDLEIFIGSIYENKAFEQYTIPKGKFAKMTIKPKLGFLWGLSIGEAKRHFYIKWIKNNKFKPLNMEYEYHTEKSLSNKPTIEIIFSISDDLK